MPARMGFEAFSVANGLIWNTDLADGGLTAFDAVLSASFIVEHLLQSQAVLLRLLMPSRC